MRINTHQELDNILNTVANELVRANILYKLYCDLNAAFADYLKEVNQSQAFWTLTRESIFEGCMIRLCRVYDNGPKTNGLPRVLDEIKTNPDFFDEMHFRERLKDNEAVDDLARLTRRPDEAQLLVDIEFCSDSNVMVKKLLKWRNNIFAHRSSKLTIKKTKLPTEHLPTYGDISELLENGMKIVNTYSGLFRALSYSTTLVGYDDYKYVLKCLRTEAERRAEELRLECQKYGISWPLDT